MASLRTRLFAFVALLLLAAALALAGATYRNVRAEADTLFDYQLRQMALSLRDQGRIDREAQAALADPALEVVVQIWSLDGVAVYSSGPPVALPARTVLGYADVQVADAPWRVYGTATPGRVIQVAQPLAVRRRLAEAAAWRSVWPVAAATPLVAAALWWLLGVSLAPLNAVVQAAGARRADALAPLPEAGLPAELRPIVQAFNALLARLGEAFAAQQAFVADAAHELRTPLTALKLQVDVLRAAVDDPAEREQALQRLGAGVDRATRLVQQLLALARSEPGAAAPMVPLDLAAVARGAADDAAPRVRATGATLTLHLPPTLPMTGDAEGLRSAVRNLLENALKYGALPGTAPRVTLSATVDGDVAVLRVDDHGPGLPTNQRSAVFERFHRLQPGGADGSGLGLAIVRAVAQHHGGQVRLDDAPGGGLRAELRLPLTPPGPHAAASAA
ncbi:MAG: sensor histidine kinase N-terminal domain-containing protein [Burkholderiaceae bacterium]|nr:sensor histidine kinase N-terminal domain-containing protein [Burkholderiaceae bacterium]